MNGSLALTSSRISAVIAPYRSASHTDGTPSSVSIAIGVHIAPPYSVMHSGQHLVATADHP